MSTTECPGCRQAVAIPEPAPLTLSCPSCGAPVDVAARAPSDAPDAPTPSPAAAPVAGTPKVRRTGTRARAASQGGGNAPRRVLSFGSLLGRSFSTWGRNLVPFTLASLVVFSPMVAFQVLCMPHRTPTADDGPMAQLEGLLMGAFSLLLSSALAFGVFETLRGRPAPVGACLGKGFSRLGSVVWTAIVLGAFLLLAAVGSAMLAAPIVILATKIGPDGIVGGFLVGLAVAAPMMLASALFFYAIPAATVERVSGKRAVDRSVDLGRRNLAPTFWVVALLTALDAAVVVGTLLAARGPDTVQVVGRLVFEVPTYDVALRVWGPFAFGVLVSAPLKAVAAAVGYHDLRTAREGVDAAAIAKVFE